MSPVKWPRQFNPDCPDCLGRGIVPDDDGEPVTCQDCPPIKEDEPEHDPYARDCHRYHAAKDDALTEAHA